MDVKFQLNIKTMLSVAMHNYTLFWYVYKSYFNTRVFFEKVIYQLNNVSRDWEFIDAKHVFNIKDFQNNEYKTGILRVTVLFCLSGMGVLSLVALDCCLWFCGTAMDKNHLYADSVVHFLSLPKMLLIAFFEIGDLLRGRMSSLWVSYTVLWKETHCISAVTYVRL